MEDLELTQGTIASLPLPSQRMARALIEAYSMLVAIGNGGQFNANSFYSKLMEIDKVLDEQALEGVKFPALTV